jgi:adenylate cyclase
LGRGIRGIRWRRVFSMDRLTGVAAIFGLLVLFVWDPYPLQFVRAKTFDFYQRIQPRTPLPIEKRPVTIIDIDEKSLGQIGQWPWPRTIVAQLIHNLTQMQASLVAFDVVFAEKDRTNASEVAKTLKMVGLDPQTEQGLLKLPSNDEAMAAAMKRGRVILGQSGQAEVAEQQQERPALQKSVATRSTRNGVTPQQVLPRYLYLLRNFPVLEAAAVGHGIFSLTPEPDGVVRRVPMLFIHEGNVFPALSLEMLRLAVNRPTILVTLDELGVRQVAVTKNLQIPTDQFGRTWPYFSKSDRKQYVSAVDVLTGKVDPKVIAGRMALIGTSAIGLLDIRSTPVDENIPGVEVHAQVIENVAQNSFLQRPGNIKGAEFLLILVGGLLMVWLVPVIGARWTLILFLFVAGGAMATSWYYFTSEKYLVDVSFGIVSVLLIYTLLTYMGYAREEAERRQVRSAFGFYLAPAMVEKLADDPSQLKLGGERRDMSILFCDVRGFTTISEQFDAVGLTQLINKLLTPLTAIIMDCQGTVDKYMGDCIMAFWNAPMDDPHHARNACLAALAMNDEMKPLNERLAAEAGAEGRKHIPLKIGIGLNSGEVVVGNMGSDQRFDYSVLGDDVNLASRLEGQCKTYAVDIVIGENTFQRAPSLATLELDLIRVKGKKEAVRIHTLLGDENLREGNAFRVIQGNHDEMIAAYRAQRWDEAADKIKACRELVDGFNLGGFYDVYEERIAEYREAPPPPDWDGVYVATSK